MLRELVLIGCASAVVAQFNFTHTQYDTSPPVYPSRESVEVLKCSLLGLTFVPANITGAGGWEAALEKARAFVGKLTIEEKAQMVTGMSD